MRHSSFALWLFPLIFPLLMVCSPSDDDPLGLDDLGDGKKVLFIGNSLTEFNDLPRMVQTIGEAAGHEISVRSITFGNFSLEDHWASGEAVRAIRRAEWDVVVLQQGPSSLPLNQAHLEEWTGTFNQVIVEQGARTALYMVWPESTRQNAFDAVSEAYTNAAESVEGMLFPVGEAWRAAWARDPQLPLYGSDGFHPSELGSTLGALVIYQQLFNESPVGLPATMVPSTPGLPTVIVEPDLAPLLQESAAQANAMFGRR